ncbi:uncharacterized protein LOC108696555 isoform X1 [Xenopus laevis]|uniref:Uncharacterized protein LOC108696555 isoform X1 n=2 Tax=Xenopus laevis TaxID=8355 RepID=A0A1L8FM67_XENLA|nr:uncharacterized protein LOC108696555 isoform X1 [Xenopus laevis]OCT72655.1 hypothetical protein XELAEV_18035638mg [Xenopus laevis]
MAQREDGAFVLHGRKAALSEKPYEFLSNTQKTTSSHNLSFQGAAHNRRLHASHDRPKEIINSPVLQYTKENPSIDDLEDNLRKLKVQVDSLASSLNLDYEKNTKPYSSKAVDRPQWPTHTNSTSSEIYSSSLVKTIPDSDWFLKPNHFMKSQENYSAVQSTGLPTFSTSSPYSMGREISGMDTVSSAVSPFDIAYSEKIPVKLGAPHVVGVKSLMPPKIPVRSRSLEKSKASVVRGRSQSIDRSHSFSPVSKKARWPRSRSQSPKPVWRPNSANACGQPAPRSKCSGKTSSSNRQSRSRFYRPGSVVTRSVTPFRKTKSNLSYSWSPYSIPSTSISAPSAEEISEKFLQTLAEGGVGRSVLEGSPYQQELARLRLERLRVEEDLLLEIKRQQELERTRGPRPKWYEMKSSQFHYEARKNNELLKSSKEYQSIYDYRQELTAASRNFQEHLKITHLDPV